MSRQPHVVVLGGGPAGCGAAFQLRRTDKATVTLLEKQDVVGGVAGSFQWGGQWLDYGSHRLHHTVAPEILQDIQRMLGPDFGDFSRHGRIRLRGQWLHFPIKTLDLLKRLDKGFALGMARDLVMTKLAKADEGDTYASVLMANLGPTMSRHFYFPYGRKMWGKEPEALSGIQARKRVSAGSFAKLIKRLLKPVGGGNYYYMREGYGQISSSTPGYTWTVTAEHDGQVREIDCDYLWSTIPITLLAKLMDAPADSPVMQAAAQIHYRAMVLVYAKLPVQQFTTTDAHYFPEENVRVTRLSEPKNYFRSTEPRGSTVLCGEYPCTIGDALWTASDAELAAIMARDAATAGIPFPAAPTDVLIRRIPQAYPIYLKGYEVPLGTLDHWAGAQPNVLVYGRQGLFAHDNTHHALFMAYCAVDCLQGMAFDQAKWAQYREIFKSHVVED
jgi:protoporphyrinogen oxidase